MHGSTSIETHSLVRLLHKKCGHASSVCANVCWHYFVVHACLNYVLCLHYMFPLPLRRLDALLVPAKGPTTLALTIPSLPSDPGTLPCRHSTQRLSVWPRHQEFQYNCQTQWVHRQRTIGMRFHHRVGRLCMYIGMAQTCHMQMEAWKTLPKTQPLAFKGTWPSSRCVL